MSTMPQTLEISIVGANCPLCLNETLDALRRVPGIETASASITDQCLRVSHRAVPLDELLGVVRRHLYADVVESSEHVMVEVDPRVAELNCHH